MELINKFSKVAAYKMNTQKSVVFLFTSSEWSEKEIRETIPCTVASKWIKYLVINLTKEIKNLYNENYKHCWKYIVPYLQFWNLKVLKIHSFMFVLVSLANYYGGRYLIWMVMKLFIVFIIPLSGNIYIYIFCVWL